MDDSDVCRHDLSRRSMFAAVLALLSHVCSADTKIQFDIPSDEFPKAILEFYYQSNIEVFFLSTNSLYNIHTRPLSGKLEPREALERMLEGTGLTFEFDSPHSVVVQRPSNQEYFDIPAGAAEVEFNEWARQAAMHVTFDYNIVKQRQTRAVKGWMSRIDALHRMISGTGLRPVEVDEGMVFVTDGVPETADSPRLADSNQRIHHGIQQTAMPEVVIAADQSPYFHYASSFPTSTYGRTDIDASGATTVEQFAGTLPQVWPGGPNEYSQLGREGMTNATSGTGFNFHSLGAESTVVLVDGVRPALSGTEAGWWDISLLPLSAIERIDVAPEGASNRYGSDAIAAVVNFETRRIEGAETQAQVGAAAGGGGTERRVTQLLGKRWDGVNAGLVLDFYNRDAIPAADRGQATSNLVPWGGKNWNPPNGYPGNLITADGQTWAITEISNGKPVPGAPGSLNQYDAWQSRDILPWQQRLSLMGQFSALLGAARLWSSVWLSNRHSTYLVGAGTSGRITIPSTNPGYVNPLGGSDPVYVQYGFGNLLGPATANALALSGSAAAGIAFEHPGWTVEVSASTALERDRGLTGGYVNSSVFAQKLSSGDPATVLNPFAPAGTVTRAVLRQISQAYYYQSYSRLHSLDASASRVLGTWAGDAILSLGGQYRRTSLTSIFPAATSGASWQNAERDVGSIYTSLDFPLASSRQRVPFIHRLDLSIGGRYEHYSDGEAVASPSASLKWSPFSGLTLRGTFRRGFRPPALTETSTSNNVSQIVRLADGRTAIAEVGGNPNLRSERARAWTGGVDFSPSEALWLSSSYYAVMSSGRVMQPIFASDVNNFNGHVLTNPTAAQIAAICNESRFVGGSTATCEQTPVDVFMDLRLQGLETLTTSGIDLSARYLRGDWKFRVDGTYLLSYRGVGLDGRVLEQRNTLNNPVALRARATAARTFDAITLSLSASHTGSYRDPLSQPQRRIGSWTTLDLVASYVPVDTSILSGSELLLGVRNLMNRQPPFANNESMAAGWDPENGGNLAGRVISGQIRWTR